MKLSVLCFVVAACTVEHYLSRLCASFGLTAISTLEANRGICVIAANQVEKSTTCANLGISMHASPTSHFAPQACGAEFSTCLGPTCTLQGAKSSSGEASVQFAVRMCDQAHTFSESQWSDIEQHLEEYGLAVIAVSSADDFIADDKHHSAVACNCHERDELYQGLLGNSSCRVSYVFIPLAGSAFYDYILFMNFQDRTGTLFTLFYEPNPWDDIDTAFPAFIFTLLDDVERFRESARGGHHTPHFKIMMSVALFTKRKWRWIGLDLQRRHTNAFPGETQLVIPIGHVETWDTKENYYIPAQWIDAAAMEPEMPFLESDVSTMDLKILPVAPEPVLKKLADQFSSPALRKLERTLASLARDLGKPSRSTAPRSNSDFGGSLPHLSQDWLDYLPIYPSPLRHSFVLGDFEDEDEQLDYGYSELTKPADYHHFASFEQSLMNEWQLDDSFETRYMSMSYRPTVDQSTNAKPGQPSTRVDVKSTVDDSSGQQSMSTAESESQFGRLTDQRERDTWWHDNMTMAYPLSGIQ
ncbi:hypothetical protein QFC22_001322 [Naganishia vaughanmartiniae]|uniref:Uncharacterized protein n=1 Tax=Naganishia vaughanmartiniae TaxID=1424756 RepID=A0ACC2XJA5_9TREE|nr:hypothetical protein QFC22_001322 [Naganishia vaughanmartiniae]